MTKRPAAASLLAVAACSLAGGCSPLGADEGLSNPPPSISSFSLWMNGETLVGESLDAYWADVEAPEDASCAPAVWLSISVHGYDDQESDVAPSVQLGAPQGFVDGALADLAADPIEAPLQTPGFIAMAPDETRVALSGGTARFSDDSVGGLTLAFESSAACSYNGGTQLTDCAPTDDVVLTMQGSIQQSDVCFTGVPGPFVDESGAALCVVEDSSLNSGGWDCALGPDHPVNASSDRG